MQIFRKHLMARKLIRKMRADKFDVIISDVSMPGKNGLEALKVIKSEAPTIPILVLSIHPEEPLKELQKCKAGASGYLTKESAPEELVKAVRNGYDGPKIYYTIASRKNGF